MMSSKTQKMPTPAPVTVKTEKGVEIPQTRKDMTGDEVKTFVDTTMEVFHGLEDMSDLKGLYEMGKSLSRAYFNCPSYRKETCDQLESYDFPVYASKMMKRLNNLGVFKNDDIWFTSFYFYNISWNFSDASGSFATALGAAGLPNLLNLNIGHQPYLDNLSSKNVYYLIKASLSIMQNIARVPGNAAYFGDESVKNSLVFLAQREEEFLKCVSTLTLAYVVTENETDLLDKGIDAVEKIITFTEKATQAEKRRYHGFTVEELMQALAALCVNDSIKKAVVTNNGIPLLKLLCASQSSMETEFAIKCLWNLGFDHDIRKRLINEFQVVPILEGLKTHDSDNIRKAAEGALWLLTKETQKVEQALVGEKIRVSSAILRKSDAVALGTSGLYNFIFVSYCHANFEMAHKVVDKLKEAGITVWVDTEHMKGNLLDGMADGIEYCQAMLLCMSDSYMQSAACRTEAEYSYQLRKTIIPINMQYKYKPFGWLGLILGAKKYYDFSGKYDFESIFPDLQTAVLDVLIKPEEPVVEEPPYIEPSVDSADGRPAVQNHLVEPVTSQPVSHQHNANANSSSNSTENNHRIEREHEPPSHGHGSSKPATTVLPIASVGPVHPRPTPLRADVACWSCAEVQRWMDDIHLSGRSKSAMIDINGRLLGQLIEMRREAPEFFFKCLQDSLGFTLVDLLIFSEALIKLTI